MRLGLSFRLGRHLRLYVPLASTHRTPAAVYMHAGCTVRHRSEGARDRCRYV